MIDQSSASRQTRLVKLILCIVIFLFAFGIRLIGIGWGLRNDLHNQSYHPDEPLIFDFVHHSNLYRGPGEHEYYNYGTLFYAILRASEAIGVATGNITAPPSLSLADVHSPQDWDAINAYSSQCILWGRYASAAAGAGTVVVVFVILAEWTTVLGALAGAALICFSPAHVEHSRFQTVDIISLFLVSLATLACLRLLKLDPGQPKKWIPGLTIAAVLTGCAASTRYSDILMILPIWAVLTIRWWQQFRASSGGKPSPIALWRLNKAAAAREAWLRTYPWKLLGLYAGVIAVIAFVITTPGSVTDTSYFLEVQKFQANHANTGHGLVFVGRPSAFLFHIYEMMVGITAPAVILALLGLIYGVYRKRAWIAVALAYFIPYFITIGILKVMFLRYDFPLYLGIALGFGYAISLIQRRLPMPAVAAGVAALCLLGIENPQAGLRGTALFTKWMTDTDPRDEAGQYLIDLAKTTPGMDVGFVGESPWFYTAAVVKDADFLEFQTPEFRQRYMASTHDPHVQSFMAGGYPMYATISSYQIEDGQRLRGRTDLDPDDAANVALNNRLWDRLNELYSIDRVFGGDGPTIHDLEYVRPTVWVLKRRQ